MTLMSTDAPIEIPVTFRQPGDVAGKRVMITGAGRGLGSVLATAFSHGGARVALVSRTQDELEEIAGTLPNESLVIAADVSDSDANERVCEQIDKAWGGLDCAILNAGISPSLEDPLLVSSRMWRKILDVNLNGVFFGARAAAAVMHDGGTIIATGSVLADRPRMGLTAYSTSKAGVVGLVKALAVDLAARRDHSERGGAWLVRITAGRRLDGRRGVESQHRRSHHGRPVGEKRGHRRGVPVPRLGCGVVHHGLGDRGRRGVSAGMSGIKIVYLVEKRAEMSDAAFVEHWTTVHADLAQTMPGVLGYSINSPSSLQRGPRPLDGYAVLNFASRDAAKEAWQSPEGLATAADGLLFMAAARALIVEERIVVGPPSSPGVKIVYLVEKRAEMSDAAFVEHWTTVHADLAQTMPGVLGYSINSPSSLQRGPRPLDGYAVLNFASRDAAKEAWQSPEGLATAADGLLFMAAARALIVDERVVVAGSSDVGGRQ